MDGLRSFIAVDNCSAVDVGVLCQGTRSLPCTKSCSSERHSQERPSKKELTSFRCELMRSVHRGPSSTQSILSLSNGDRHWLMRTGMPSAKQSTKELKGKNWRKTLVILQESQRDHLLELVAAVSRWMFSVPDLLQGF